MTAVNATQVGGTHYKTEYEHWDFVLDTDQDYLLGNATKYLARHAKKNGRQDLLKCLHYIKKMTDCLPDRNFHVTSPTVAAVVTEHHTRLTRVFAGHNGLDEFDQAVLCQLVTWKTCQDLVTCSDLVQDIINVRYPHPADEPGPGYVNQG